MADLQEESTQPARFVAWTRNALRSGAGFLLRRQFADGRLDSDPALTARAASVLAALHPHHIEPALAAACRARAWLQANAPSHVRNECHEENTNRGVTRATWDTILGTQTAEGYWPAVPQTDSTSPRTAFEATLVNLQRLSTLPPAPSLFRDVRDEEAFMRDGYVILRSRASADVLHAIEDACAPDLDMRGPHFQTSVYGADLRARARIHDAVQTALGPMLADALPHHRMLLGSFAAKPARAIHSAMPLHQDPTWVDERHWRTINAWVPTRDVSIDDGCMTLVPGSHLLRMAPRGFYQGLPWPALGAVFEERYAVPVPMRAGEILLFHHGLFHASPPNRSDTLRLAAAAVLVPTAAPLIYCHRPQGADGPIDVYSVGDDFYASQHIGRPPHQGTLLGRWQAPPPPPLHLCRYERGQLRYRESLRPYEAM